MLPQTVLTPSLESTGDQLSKKEMMILMPCARAHPTILSRPSTASQLYLPAHRHQDSQDSSILGSSHVMNDGRQFRL